jgi:ribosome-associated toxin RatA of RatAB toxin-antitoxin module
MERVTKPGGYLLSIVFSTEDEYYAEFLKNRPDGTIVCDPANGIWKRLYSEQEIKSFFSKQFELKYFVKFEFSDCVLGNTFKRVLFTSVLRKTSS